ncbi:MAG: ABC transporter substrate-binding protein [Alphaproteobacteria bacterium]|nr:ABC transporter substrate-binding protein [Alphaproteobacteria bacterium]
MFMTRGLRPILLGATAALTLAGAAVAQQAAPLRIAIPNLPPPLADPYKSGAFSSPGVFFMGALYDGLTFVGEDGNIKAWLAESWKNVDKDTWQFTLRANAKFSNGRPVTAEAVAKNIDIITSDYGKTTNIGSITPSPATARAVGPLTVEIKTKSPNPVFDKEIGGLPIIDPDAWKDLGVENFAKTPVTTGSFKIVGANPPWASGAIEFEPHTGSWHPGKAPRLIISAVPERPARVQAIESGQIEVAVGLNMDAFEPIEKSGNIVYTAPAPLVYAIPLISTRPESPFKDVRVRQAVNYALDKESMVKNLLRGRATAASQPATPNTYGFNPDVKPYPFDTAKAKQLLAAAGYPNGFKTRLEAVMGGSQTADTEIYQQVGIDLKRAGVDVDVINVTFGDWLKKWLPGPDAQQLLFPDMFGLGYFLTPEVDAINGFKTHWCDKKPQWYCNETIRPKVEQARSEFDPAKRKAVLQDLMKTLHDDAPVLFLVNQVDVVGVNKRVKNFAMTNRFMSFSDMTLN